VYKYRVGNSLGRVEIGAGVVVVWAVMAKKGDMKNQMMRTINNKNQKHKQNKNTIL